jgi:hypothetical protein
MAGNFACALRQFMTLRLTPALWRPRPRHQELISLPSRKAADAELLP